MKEKEIPNYEAPYTKQCDNCGKLHEVRTQQDHYPEYYTDVYLKCDCGDFVLFKLPVN